MTTNKPMTGEQLDELMTVAVNMQRDSEKVGERSVAMFAYAVQIAVLELRKVRSDMATLAAEVESKRRALAAILERCPVTHPHIDTGVAGMIAFDNLDFVKTPATDVFMAEVRAQGVEMFADSLKVVGGHDHPYSAVANDFAAQLCKGAQS